MKCKDANARPRAAHHRALERLRGNKQRRECRKQTPGPRPAHHRVLERVGDSASDARTAKTQPGRAASPGDQLTTACLSELVIQHQTQGQPKPSPGDQPAQEQLTTASLSELVVRKRRCEMMTYSADTAAKLSSG